MPRLARTRTPSEVFDQIRFLLRGIEEIELPPGDRNQLAEALRSGLEVLLPHYGGEPVPEKKSKARSPK